MWFRIEMNKDGSVLKAEHVEAKLTGGGRFVVYVDAETKESAIASAVSRYQRYLEKQRTDKKARVDARKNSGRCVDCGRPGVLGRVRCQRCAERLNAYRQRGRGRPHELPAPIPAGSRSQRAIILAEVMDQALALRAGVAFLSWLRNELEHARSAYGKVAAE